ncbi:DNA glycosylase AlkZ-like family protein [Puerhibacterium sp. TATVAM-FAB25]|uniref:DNA glycosylase AlkZ-like family protein n=1 Tax=Puerhibacterium sp. TATVAM-FAB25 TaxID=3093699 RepID=UPI00397B8646
MAGAAASPGATSTPLDADAVRRARLRAHRLLRPDLPGLPAVVGHLLAVQGQEFFPALWGAVRRVAPGARPDAAASVAAFDAGAVLRTHVLRPTWHLVRPDDARWLLELTAARVLRTTASTERGHGIADPARCLDAVTDLVAAGPLTRAEVKDGLVARGLLAPDATGFEVGQVLMTAELHRAVISGPLRGRQHTYAAFDDRVPPGYGPLGERFDRDAALVELWRGYLRGRAWATVRDAAQWSGLTLTELRRGLGLLREAAPGAVVDAPGTGALEGLTLHGLAEVVGAGPDGVPGAAPDDGGPGVDLLQGYDELFVGYGPSRLVVRDPVAGEEPLAPRPALLHVLAVDGLVAGRWRWTAGPRRLDVATAWARPASPAEEAALAARAAEAAAWWGLELRVE